MRRHRTLSLGPAFGEYGRTRLCGPDCSRRGHSGTLAHASLLRSDERGRRSQRQRGRSRARAKAADSDAGRIRRPSPYASRSFPDRRVAPKPHRGEASPRLLAGRRLSDGLVVAAKPISRPRPSARAATVRATQCQAPQPIQATPTRRTGPIHLSAEQSVNRASSGLLRARTKTRASLRRRGSFRNTRPAEGLPSWRV
jgi:hypothetical protein